MDSADFLLFSKLSTSKSFYLRQVIVYVWQFLLLRGFEITDHIFPEPGHTFLHSDRDFANVQQNILKHEKLGDNFVCSSDQYHEKNDEQCS